MSGTSRPRKCGCSVEECGRPQLPWSRPAFGKARRLPAPLGRSSSLPHTPCLPLFPPRPAPSRHPPRAQTPESKKQEFRKYLEKSGVIDALTKVLVGLYEEPERPPNAVDYIKRYMGAPTGIDVEAMRAELEQLKIDKAGLETTVKELNERLAS